MDNKTYDKIYCSDKYHKLGASKRRKEPEYFMYMTKEELLAYLTNKEKPKDY